MKTVQHWCPAVMKRLILTCYSHQWCTYKGYDKIKIITVDADVLVLSFLFLAQLCGWNLVRGWFKIIPAPWSIKIKSAASTPYIDRVWHSVHFQTQVQENSIEDLESTSRTNTPMLIWTEETIPSVTIDFTNEVERIVVLNLLLMHA